MTSGKATTLAALCLLTLPTASRAAPDAAALIARLARPAPATTAYVEVRFVDMLKRPLVLKGAMEYAADGGLVKRVDDPYHETTTVRAGQVTLEREGKSPRRFALNRAPELAAFLESFAALLGGNSARLAQTYEVESAGDDAHWRLTLTPKAPALRKHLARIRVDGAADRTRCFSVDEAGSDGSILLVEDTAKIALPATPTRENLSAICRAE